MAHGDPAVFGYPAWCNADRWPGEMADHEPNRNPPIRINIQPLELRRLQNGGEQAGEKERMMAGQKDIYLYLVQRAIIRLKNKA